MEGIEVRELEGREVRGLEGREVMGLGGREVEGFESREVLYSSVSISKGSKTFVRRTTTGMKHMQPTWPEYRDFTNKLGRLLCSDL